MQGGILRRKVRTDRRRGLPLEPVWSFYAKYLVASLHKLCAIARQAYFLYTLRKHIERDPLAKTYTDVALTSVQDDEVEELELFTHSADAKAAVEHARQTKSRLTAAG
jgi:hypothetical protein